MLDCAMEKLVSYALLGVAILSAAALPLPSQTPTPEEPPLAGKIHSILAEPGVSRAHWGIAVTRLDGFQLFGFNEGQLFRPASNAKLFTTTTAIALLGPEKTFTTKVVGRGTFSEADSHLAGDVVLLGDGDPNLSGRTIPYLSPKDRTKQSAGGPPPRPLRYLEEMADAVAATGLKTVDGNVVGDDTLFPWQPYAADWSIEDAVWGYGAPVSALTVTDNQLVLTVRPAKSAGAAPTITISPALPAYYTIDASALTTGDVRSGSHVQIDRAPGSRSLRLYGSIAVDAPPDSEEVAINDPAHYAALAFKEMLEARGITFSGDAQPKHRLDTESASFLSVAGRPVSLDKVCDTSQSTAVPQRVLAQHRSVPLGDDLVVTNKVSQNLHAELFLHQLGLRIACDGSAASGAGVVRSFLLTKVGLDPDDFVFYDGSGLSGHDLVTPRATVRLLAFASRQPWFAAWKPSLPIGGEDGTLASRFPGPPLKDKLFAKTGTLGEARALSGYVTAASGATLIFSIMVDNHTPRTTADRDAMDRIVQAVAAAN